MVSAVLCIGYFSPRKVTPQQSEIEVTSFDYDAVHTGNPTILYMKICTKLHTLEVKTYTVKGRLCMVSGYIKNSVKRTPEIRNTCTLSWWSIPMCSVRTLVVLLTALLCLYSAKCLVVGLWLLKPA